MGPTEKTKVLDLLEEHEFPEEKLGDEVESILVQLDVPVEEVSPPLFEVDLD